MLEQKEYTAEEREEYINSLGIDYSAEFVPFSQSRNKADKDKSLNWIVCLKANNVELKTDYMQGQAHIKGYKHVFGSVTVDEGRKQRYIIEVGCEQGREVLVGRNSGSLLPKKQLAPPKLIDVLYSLSMDSDVLDSPCYEDWAANFGYDEDSRKGEKIYRACLEIALKMRAMFGDARLQSLRDVFQDY